MYREYFSGNAFKNSNVGLMSEAKDSSLSFDSIVWKCIRPIFHWDKKREKVLASCKYGHIITLREGLVYYVRDYIPFFTIYNG